MNTNNFFKKFITALAPVLGAGGVGVCPLCWVGSASLLTYVGLGGLIPFWRWISFGAIFVGALGFLLDYRAHRNLKPLLLLGVGAILLYLGRYVYGGAGFGGWPIWGFGGVVILAAVFYNKSLFRKSVRKGGSVMNKEKRLVQVFTAGCPACAEAVEMVKGMVCFRCDLRVLDLRTDREAQEKARLYGIKRVPAVAVDGRLADCCQMGGIDPNRLRTLGVGQ